MTRKEAKEKLYMEWQKFLEDNIDYAGISEAYKIAFKALEQEPCNDCISRQAVFDIVDSYSESRSNVEDVTQDMISDIMVLPSVNPQEPKTVLYSGNGYADGYMVYDMAECPNCGYEYEDGDKDWGLSFCPSCGQKLNWESEEA